MSLNEVWWVNDAKQPLPQGSRYRPTFWFSPRTGSVVDYAKKRLRRDQHDDGRAHAEFRKAAGGAAEIAYRLADEWEWGKRVAITVAGNSGRPGGAVGRQDGWGVDGKQIHGGHGTQEEDIVSNWMITETKRWVASGAGQGEASKQKQAHMDEIFMSTIGGRWGMEAPGSRSGRTIQGVDYRRTRNPMNYADAWVVQNVRMSSKDGHSRWFLTELQFKADLVFVSGPNAGAKGKSKTGSTALTMNTWARDHYEDFEEMVQVTLRTALDAMVVGGVDVAVLGLVSAGLYAGDHKKMLLQKKIGTGRTRFMDLVDGVLMEEVGPKGEKRWQYFDHVVLAGIRNPKKVKEEAGDGQGIAKRLAKGHGGKT